MKFSGIYKISSVSCPDKFYIGSAVSLENRKRDHWGNLVRNRHDNPILQNHCNKYGINDLVFSILLFCEESELITTEQDFLDFYKPALNICKMAGNTLGYRHTPETKEKFKNRICSAETRKKFSDAKKGKPSMWKGKKASSETREKQRNAKLGKKRGPMSPEHKLKIGEANKGKIPWSKGKKNCYSEETNKRRVESIRKTKELKKQNKAA